MIKAILTDIEGTTSSVSFVKDVLFPYAAKQLPDYVREHDTEKAVREQLDATAELANIPSHDSEALIQQLIHWIETDTKATPLKALQGMVWERGYESGAYQAHVYADAVRRLREWFEDGIDLFVYSSGSVQAQKLFFQYSRYGDMRPLFTGYFDTTTGAKHDTASYQAIAREIDTDPDRILFLSDIEAELDAASAAGLRTCRLVRSQDVDGEAATSKHRQVASFDDISPRSLED